MSFQNDWGGKKISEAAFYGACRKIVTDAALLALVQQAGGWAWFWATLMGMIAMGLVGGRIGQWLWKQNA